MTRRKFAARCGLLVAALGLALGGVGSATAAPAPGTGDKAPAAEAGKPEAGKPEPGKPEPGKPGPGKPGPGKGCDDPGKGVGVNGTVTSIEKKGDVQILRVTTEKEAVTVLVTQKTLVVKDKPKGEPAVLKVGDKVMVKGVDDGKGVIDAVAVVVLT
jgi:hypothetical protein